MILVYDNNGYIHTIPANMRADWEEWRINTDGAYDVPIYAVSVPDITGLEVKI